MGRLTNTAIGLRSSRDHVLDEITMARGVNDGDIVLGSLKLPEGDVDGDTTFTLGFQLVENPGIFERALSEFSSFLLELHAKTDQQRFLEEAKETTTGDIPSRWFACRYHRTCR
jgi:hypothetical protein